jgi:putative component of toxin-antitoxin plasmid stabilization module
MSIIKINFYETSRGKQPFVDWQEDLDEVDQAIIDARLTRVRLGNFGDCTRIKGGEGIW